VVSINVCLPASEPSTAPMLVGAADSSSLSTEGAFTGLCNQS
jgi:hypothetical protein